LLYGDLGTSKAYALVDYVFFWLILEAHPVNIISSG
jgi:hypothetical protein